LRARISCEFRIRYLFQQRSTRQKGSMRPVQLLFRCCLITLPALLLTPSLLQAQQAEVLTVKVRDVADNSPITGATVSLYNDENELVGTETSSEEDGNAVFEFDPALSVHSPARQGSTLGEAHPNPFA